jgi:hypothetical protein
VGQSGLEPPPVGVKTRCSPMSYWPVRLPLCASCGNRTRQQEIDNLPATQQHHEAVGPGGVHHGYDLDPASAPEPDRVGVERGIEPTKPGSQPGALTRATPPGDGLSHLAFPGESDAARWRCPHVLSGCQRTKPPARFRWLGDQDSNLDRRCQRPRSLPLDDLPVRGILTFRSCVRASWRLFLIIHFAARTSPVRRPLPQSRVPV